MVAVPIAGTAMQPRWLADLSQLLAFPSVSADSRHRPDMEAAARWLAAYLTRIGLENATVLSGEDGGAPSVYAEWLRAPGKPVLLCYGHYDVSPTGPRTAWQTPPFRATRIGERLYARGASDDKGQLFVHLAALAGCLAGDGRLPVNVKVWLEGEEEIGSPHIQSFLASHTERLRADAVLVSDTQMLAPDQPTIVYALRGLVTADLEVQSAGRDLHSGLYGGAVTGAVEVLARILAGLYRSDGLVDAPGFYGAVRPVPPAERAALRGHLGPDADRVALPAAAGRWGRPDPTRAERILIQPSLTVTGIAASGHGKSVIPHRARARLSARLVPDQDPSGIAAALRRRIAALTPAGARSTFTVTGGVPPVLLPRRHRVIDAAFRAVTAVWRAPPTFTRSGGTIPFVAAYYRRFRTPIVMLGFGLRGDNQHAPDESLHLPTVARGVPTVTRFLHELAR